MIGTAANRRLNINNQGIPYSEQGQIESVSVQGTQIFIVARLSGQKLPDMMGNPVNCGRHLVGIPRYAPENNASMAEILIPLNVTSSIQVTDPKTLIGSKVQIFFKSNGFPEGAMLMGNPDSRDVSREELFNLRLNNKDLIIDQFTKKKMGESDPSKLKKIEESQSEVYDQEFHKGAVGTYGDKQNMFVATESHRGDYVDFSTKGNNKNSALVDTNKTTRKKECYQPTTVFTGRS